MTATDEGFLTRAEIIYLKAKLDCVRDLEQEMAIALTGQTRPASGGYTRHVKPGSRPPYPIALAELLDELRNELTTTARVILDYQKRDYDGGQSLSGVAAWINHERYALSFIDGAGEIFESLCRVIDRCRSAMGHIEHDHVIDQARVEAANRQVVTRDAVEKMAPKLGDVGKGLTARRVRTLEKSGRLRRTGTDEETGTAFYRLGDVLAAHEAGPRHGKVG